MGRKVAIKTVLTTTLGIGLLAFSLELSASEEVRLDVIRDQDANLFRYDGLRMGLGYELQYSSDLADWKHAKVIFWRSDSWDYPVVKTYMAGPQGFFRIKQGIPEGVGEIVMYHNVLTPSPRTVRISPSDETEDAALAVFEIRSAYSLQTAMLEEIRFRVNISGAPSSTSVFSGFVLEFGGGGYIMQQAGTNTIKRDFTLRVPLPSNQFIPMTLYGTVAKNADHAFDGATVSVSVDAEGSGGGIRNNPKARYPNGELVEVAAGSPTSNELVFRSSDASVTLMTTKVDSQIMSLGELIGLNVSFAFTVNAGNEDLYLPAEPTRTLTFFLPETQSTFLKDDFAAEAGPITNDAKDYFVIPKRTSRRFVAKGSIVNSHSLSGGRELSRGYINFGLSPESLESMSFPINSTVVH